MASDVPSSLDTLLYEAVAPRYHHPEIRPLLRRAVEQYGARNVAASLLGLIEGGLMPPAFGSRLGTYPQNLAAAVYGLAHSMYPDSIPLGVLVSRLTSSRRLPELPDKVKEGILFGLQYRRVPTEEMLRALEGVLCQTAYHLRPFLRHLPWEEPRRSDVPRWFTDAVLLLNSTVATLMTHPEGDDVLSEFLRTEEDEALKAAVQEMMADPDTLPSAER